MDCFYAAIEERENPALRGKPLGVGGSSRRGVLTTANYEARRFGCRSAMPVFQALQLCPQLIIVPVRFDLYRAEAARIREIFLRFTGIIEPLSLDEAYLDVSHRQSSGSAIAAEIRAEIREETGLTASAGIAPNKLLAKIASDWNKPNGQHEIREEQIEDFLRDLPVSRLWGVGPKMKERLASLGVHTCGELRRFDKIGLTRRFGSWGLELFQLCRGIDDRPVEVQHIRKSLSNECTFPENVPDLASLLPHLQTQIEELSHDLARGHEGRVIRSLLVKLKFADFTQTTAERAQTELHPSLFEELLAEAWRRGAGRPVRLLGVGVRFRDPEEGQQLDLF